MSVNKTGQGPWALRLTSTTHLASLQLPPSLALIFCEEPLTNAVIQAVPGHSSGERQLVHAKTDTRDYANSQFGQSCVSAGTYALALFYLLLSP